MQRSDEDHPNVGTEEHSLGHVVTMLTELRNAVEDLRTCVAGVRKDRYTVDEVARMTGRAPYTVRTWIRQGRIRADRVVGTGPKGRLLVPREELKKLIASGNGAELPDVVGGNS